MFPVASTHLHELTGKIIIWKLFRGLVANELHYCTAILFSRQDAEVDIGGSAMIGLSIVPFPPECGGPTLDAGLYPHLEIIL